MSEIFSKNLKTLRKKEFITQKELATALKVSQATINQWEHGYEPNFDTLIELASFFKIEVAELIENNKMNTRQTNFNEQQNLTKEEKDLLDSFRELTEQQKAELRGFIKGLLATNKIKL